MRHGTSSSKKNTEISYEKDLTGCFWYMGLKNFKFNHVKAVLSIINLCSFNRIAMNLSLVLKNQGKNKEMKSYFFEKW